MRTEKTEAIAAPTAGKITLLLFFPILAVSGCGMIYTNVHTPRAYRTAVPSEVKSAAADETVTGTACARSVAFLFAWGDAGYAAAARDALTGRQDVVLYDVKTDVRVKSYALGLYAEGCTILTGRVGRL